MKKTILLLAFLFISAVAAIAVAGEQKRVYTDEELASMPEPGPNPFLSFLPVGAEVDWNYWHAKREFESELRAQRMVARGVPAINEVEPNNSLVTVQVLDTFGSGNGEDSQLIVSGSISSPLPTGFVVDPEDNGSIPLATSVTISSGEIVATDALIGDGPHGSSGSGNADFDFFELANVVAGDVIRVEVMTSNPTGDLDPNTAIWNSAGQLLEFNEDISGANFDSRLTFTVPVDGTYYISVGGWKTGGPSVVLPGNPFDSSSGTGVASEGSYTIEIGLNGIDIDCYGLNLEPGDMLGADLQGAGTLVELFLANGELQMGSTGSAAGFYPGANPLPGGNVTIDFVTYESNQHGVCVQGNVGNYTLDLGVFRHIFEGSQDKQILFIDFDGAEIDTSIFSSGGGPSILSPLSDFLANWGLMPGDEDALIDAIVASVEESITGDLSQQSNLNFDVEIRNSRDHADTFGVDPNVSRLIVGGTIAESGISTIGIAESIDPGNFEPGESALILLDLLSAPAGNPNSLNQFAVSSGSSKINLVAAGVGNITAHEAGHYLGNWHTENSGAGAGPSIMDRGGNLAGSVGVGSDSTFGTADDIDVDFIPDLFSFAEGFSGTEHTNEKTAFALTGASTLIFSDSFESAPK